MKNGLEGLVWNRSRMRPMQRRDQNLCIKLHLMVVVTDSLLTQTLQLPILVTITTKAVVDENGLGLETK
jgi:hypothetical protein